MAKPRVLVISPYKFFPPISGGSILIFNHVRLLSKFYDVEIVVPMSRADSNFVRRDALDLLGKVHYIELPSHRLTNGPGSLSYMLRNYPRAIFAKYPIVDVYDFYNDPKVLNLINGDFKVIQLNHSWFYHPALKGRQGKFLLIQHNYEYEYWREMARALIYQRKYFTGVSYLLGSRKIKDQEQEALNEADLVIALSERERRIFKDVYGLKDHCHVINPGIDVASYRALPDIKLLSETSKSLSLIYIGTFSAPQNTAGVIKFIKDIYDQVKKSLSFPCRLFIVGKDPNTVLQQLAKQDPSITLTGFVDDVKPWIMKSDVYIVPLANGSGIRFKIMEAMIMGKPIVTTKKGAEGLDINLPGVIVVDDAQDFVSAIVTLANDPNVWLRAGKANADYAYENFDCDKIFQQQTLSLYKYLIDTE